MKGGAARGVAPRLGGRSASVRETGASGKAMRKLSSGVWRAPQSTAEAKNAPDRSEAERAVAPATAALGSVAGVVLAGSQPWGACPLERMIPRPLAPIANEPLIVHQLSWFSSGGIGPVGICGNGYTDIVRRELTSGRSRSRVPSGLSVEYFQDLAPRGPAGCARDAGLATGRDTVVVVDGSIIPQVDVRDVVNVHLRTGAGLTVVVSPTPGMRGPRGESMTPAGVYVFSRSIFEHIPSLGYQDIKESLVPRLHRADVAVVSYRTGSLPPRVYNVDSYMAVNEWMCGQICAVPARRRLGGLQDYRWEGQTGAHPTAVINAGATLVGPVLLGAGTEIGTGVTLVGPTIVGKDCKIEAGAVVGRTCVWDECRVESGVVLDRCIVGTGATVSRRAGSGHRFMVFSRSARRRLGIGRLGGRGRESIASLASA